jgi:hypothetical protein
LIPALVTFAKTGEMLVGTGGLITTAVEALAKARARAKRTPSILLGDAEQDVLADLERFSRKGPLLLIADNLHWWDFRSLELLRSLRGERMCQSLPFLTEMRVLAVQTTERYQEVANPRARDSLLAPMTTRYFPLQPIPREGFEKVLASLGEMAEPSPEVADVVYDLSGGHLALAKQCAERIKADEAEALLSSANSEEFVWRLLSKRISTLGPLGAQAVHLLQVAAVLGLAFDRSEVMCASQAEEAETARLLRFCRDEKMLELTDERWVFVHDRYRRYFLGLDSGDQIGIHERWSDCLRLLRPSQYDLRCITALDAERAREAASFGIMAALQAERDGRPWKELPERIIGAIGDCDQIQTLELLTAAFDHLQQYRFGPCQDSLDLLPHDLPQCIRAEGDYLRAMCLMSTRGESDRAQGRAILASWQGYEETEPELGMRLMLLLLYGQFHLLDKDPAWELDARIRKILNDRISLDLAARDALHVLERCAGGLYASEVALRKNRVAAAYFGPEDGSTIVRRPVEYYRCLVNLGASLIGNGCFEQATDVYRDVGQLVDSYAKGVFPRIDYPLMNRLIAEYRMGIVSAEEAAHRQRQIAVDFKVEGDPFYVDNALAVYLALAGEHKEALEIFDRLDAELTRSRTMPEPSMVYLIRANRCAVRYVAGAVAAAYAEWDTLATVACESAYTDRDVVLRRHELLAKVFEQREQLSAREFDEYLVKHNPEELGPLWETSGLGFMMPAIEFWREN